MMKNEKENVQLAAEQRARYHAADVNDKIIINLRDLSHVMRSLYEGRGSQKRILIVLHELGEVITQRELTDRLGIQPGSASEVIAKLESAGCITRTISQTDRRTTDIELTEIGKRLAAEAKEQRVRRHEEMFSCLTDEEKGQLLDLLEKVNDDWKNRYPRMEERRKPGGHGRRGDHHHHREEYRPGRE